jgi:hypothetical protein
MRRPLARRTFALRADRARRRRRRLGPPRGPAPEDSRPAPERGSQAADSRRFRGGAPESDNWPRGVTVRTLDSESSDRGSNPREAFLISSACGGPHARHRILFSAGRDAPHPVLYPPRTTSAARSNPSSSPGRAIPGGHPRREKYSATSARVALRMLAKGNCAAPLTRLLSRPPAPPQTAARIAAQTGHTRGLRARPVITNIRAGRRPTRSGESAARRAALPAGRYQGSGASHLRPDAFPTSLSRR